MSGCGSDVERLNLNGYLTLLKKSRMGMYLNKQLNMQARS